MKQKIEPKLHSRSREGDAHRTTMASPRKGVPLSSTIRFLGILKQPDSVAGDNLFELDEGDVVWSSTGIHSHSPPRAPISSAHRRNHHHHHHHQYRSDKSGLSAALSGDAHMVRRKSALNPSLSAVSAARNIAPVPFHRPETSPVSAAPKFPQSAPINVPVWRKSVGEYEMRQFEEIVEFDDDDEEEEMIPPHEMVARSQMATFSVFEGVGRTLKGRDLRRVRNAVFQQTGFID